MRCRLSVPRGAARARIGSKSRPSDVFFSFQDAPVDASHDLALDYEIWRAAGRCAPFTYSPPPLTRTPGVNTGSRPDLAPPPPLVYYQIVSVNDGGQSLPSPTTICP